MKSKVFRSGVALLILAGLYGCSDKQGPAKIPTDLNQKLPPPPVASGGGPAKKAGPPSGKAD